MGSFHCQVSVLRAEGVRVDRHFIGPFCAFLDSKAREINERDKTSQAEKQQSTGCDTIAQIDAALSLYGRELVALGSRDTGRKLCPGEWRHVGKQVERGGGA